MKTIGLYSWQQLCVLGLYETFAIRYKTSPGVYNADSFAAYYRKIINAW